MKKISSAEFMLVSECVNQTVQGMWGNAPRPEPVREIKQIERDLSVGFGPRKEYAAALLRADALQGALPIYVRARPTVVADGRPNVGPQQVPPALLKRVLPAACRIIQRTYISIELLTALPMMQRYSLSDMASLSCGDLISSIGMSKNVPRGIGLRKTAKQRLAGAGPARTPHRSATRSWHLSIVACGGPPTGCRNFGAC